MFIKVYAKDIMSLRYRKQPELDNTYTDYMVDQGEHMPIRGTINPYDEFYIELDSTDDAAYDLLVNFLIEFSQILTSDVRFSTINGAQFSKWFYTKHNDSHSIECESVRKGELNFFEHYVIIKKQVN